MPKTTTASMDTHLAGEVTSLAMGWLVTRTDGRSFRFTTSSEDQSIDVGDGSGSQTFTAAEGYSRSNIQNDADLSVNNMTVLGVFANQQLDETELRRGLFDFAEVRIFIFDQKDITRGIIKELRGHFGEAVVTPDGFFTVELRSLEDVYTQELEERYSKDCRADLGDGRCLVPILPDLLPASAAVAVGEFYRIPENPDPSAASQIILNGEGADGSTAFVNEGTQGNPDQVAGNVQIDTAQAPAGGDSTSSILFDGSGDILRWLDASWNDIGTNMFQVQAHIRLAGSGSRTIFSKYEATTTDRVFHFSVSGTGVLSFTWFVNGTNTVQGTINSGATTISNGVDTHVAVSRDENGDVRMFINGSQVGATVNDPTAFHNSNERLRIGALESGFTETNFFNGWIDSFEFINGFYRWNANFTPPAGNLDAAAKEFITEEFADRIYEVTGAGTTLVAPAPPDTTVGNSHSQGSATLTARQAWTRAAQVVAVDPTQPRRRFTVTEYTPNTAHAASNKVLTTVGFPDDHLNFGAVTFDTGDNAGRSMEVRDFVADDGITIQQEIELFSDLPFDISVGDKLGAYPGCDKRFLASCVGKFDNGDNVVAEPFTSSPDIMGQYPDAR